MVQMIQMRRQCWERWMTEGSEKKKRKHCEDKTARLGCLDREAIKAF